MKTLIQPALFGPPKEIVIGAGHAAARETVSYTAFSTFQTCRRRFLHRFVSGLVPKEKSPALRFGTVTHLWLEAWHRSRSAAEAQAIVDSAFVNRASDRDEKRDWHLQTALLKAYTAQYPTEDFEVVALEQEFAGPLVNPATGWPSRSFVVRGKVDGIVRRGDTFMVLEHKTSASVNGDYLDRLAMDLQILLYSHYARESLKHPVSAIIYNVLMKPRLVQAEGETEEQYELRKADLEAKSKTGKPSTAKRKLPESDDEFQARLAEWFAAEPRFIRVELILDFDSVANVRQTLWDISKEILDARRLGHWHQNTRACHGFGTCAYWPLCSSKDNPTVLENLFEHEGPHPELEERSEEAF
jgi:hypothetical protein